VPISVINVHPHREFLKLPLVYTATVMAECLYVWEAVGLRVRKLFQ
jgi:hypothetical protein